MRRHNALGSIITNMLKSELDYKKGKLHIYPSTYIFSDKGCTNRQGVFLSPCILTDGRQISLTLTSGVNNCPCPPIENAVPNEQLSTEMQNYFWVPLKDCRKCQYHIRHTYTKRSKNRCALLQKLRSAARVGEQTAHLVNLAVAKADELLNGKPGKS